MLLAERYAINKGNEAPGASSRIEPAIYRNPAGPQRNVKRRPKTGVLEWGHDGGGAMKIGQIANHEHMQLNFKKIVALNYKVFDGSAARARPHHHQPMIVSGVAPQYGEKPQGAVPYGKFSRDRTKQQTRYSGTGVFSNAFLP
jgi:hypothetical protein